MITLTLTVVGTSSLFALWTPQVTPLSYVLEVRAVSAPQIPVMEFTGTLRSRTVSGLAAGKQYEFTVRPIYEDGISGTDVSAIEATRGTGEPALN